MLRALLGFSLIALVAACDQTGPPQTAGTDVIRDVATGSAIDRVDLAKRLDRADVVVLGELHDNPDHHLAQAWLVDRLAPEGLAFEMIPQASEEGIVVFLAGGGDPADIGPAIGWERIGWPDWDIYRPIFEAAGTPVITGGGLGRSEIRKAIADGAFLAIPDPRFRAVLARALDANTQTAMETEMIDAHCGMLPASAAPGMVEAQRLRDASFAAAVLRARSAGGGQVVLITGNGHARTDHGVPAYLAAVAPELEVLSLGQIEGPVPTVLEELPYDYVWAWEPMPRADPCELFRRK